MLEQGKKGNTMMTSTPSFRLLSTSYVFDIFSVGLGRAYPMALLNTVIHSSFFWFCSESFTIDVTMMTYTINI